MTRKKVMGCLARTSMVWFDYINNNKLNNYANFWKPCDQNFHVLKKGGKMYLYDSNSQKFVGVATFTGTSAIKDVRTAWNEYLIRNGQSTLVEFKKLLSNESNTGKKFNDDDSICCIDVEDIKKFKIPVDYTYGSQQMFKKLFVSTDIIKDMDNIDYNDELIKKLEEAESIQ